MKHLRKLVILSHRYLGIVLSLLVVMWFATGITMMWAGGMPRLTPELRLERLPPLDLERVRLTPSEAAERAGFERPPARLTLVSVMNRPAYRLSDRDTTVVFADDGEVLDGVSPAQARAIASAFVDVPADRVHHVRTLTTVDQWTLVQGRQLPLYKFAVADANATEVYVQPATADVAQVTTRRSRMLAWISTIPHWLYFTSLRTNQPVWYRVVAWTSAAATLLALLGVVLAVTQFRRTRPFRVSTAIPYAGWMRWHYATGAVFGIFTVTFAFSGFLSMEPFSWTTVANLDVPRTTFSGGPLDLSRFDAVDVEAWREATGDLVTKEIEFVRIHDDPYYLVRHAGPQDLNDARERLHQPYNIAGRAEENRLLVAAGTLQVRREPFAADALLSRLKAAVPAVPIVASEILTDYDSYYYSRAQLTPLPVLRVKFGDPAATWVYVDPALGQVLAQVHRYSRVERWLYNGLHSMDFAFWYRSPAWAIVMVTLCLGGLASSGMGLVLGVRRIRRALRRAVPVADGAGIAELEQRGAR
jgi:hypothetical protein